MNFFFKGKKNKGIGIPIRLFTPKKSVCIIILNIMKTLYASFQLFSLSAFKVRSNFIHFSIKKKTSNRSKPIGVLTPTKSSCSDDRLPIGYSMPDFRPNWSNFFVTPTAAAAALTRKEGGRHVGGAPPPQTPPVGLWA